NFFFFQAEDGIRDFHVTGVQTCALPILAQVEKQLALCEGSDWFWWFGDYNPAESVSDFEYLYRRHLMNLYALIDQPAPDYLCQTISTGSGSPAAGGVMRQGHAEA